MSVATQYQHSMHMSAQGSIISCIPYVLAILLIVQCHVVDSIDVGIQGRSRMSLPTTSTSRTRASSSLATEHNNNDNDNDIQPSFFLDGLPSLSCTHRIDPSCIRQGGVCMDALSCADNGHVFTSYRLEPSTVASHEATGAGENDVLVENMRVPSCGRSISSDCGCCSPCRAITNTLVDGFKCRLYRGTCTSAIECNEVGGRYYPTLCGKYKHYGCGCCIGIPPESPPPPSPNPPPPPPPPSPPPRYWWEWLLPWTDLPDCCFLTLHMIFCVYMQTGFAWWQYHECISVVFIHWFISHIALCTDSLCNYNDCPETLCAFTKALQTHLLLALLPRDHLPGKRMISSLVFWFNHSVTFYISILCM